MAEAGIVDIGVNINGVDWSLTAVSGLILGIRLYVKLARRRGLWWDDYLLLASWIFLVVQVSVVSYSVHLGYGKHVGDVPTENLLPLVLLATVTTVFTLFAAAWSKTSFALTLLRITSGRLKAVVWATIVSMNLILTFNALLPFISCNPTPKSWNPAIPGSCWDPNALLRYGIFAAAYSAAMDFILAFISWLVIMRLQMQPKEKMGVAICMSLGLVAGGTSIVRCTKIPLLQQADFTFQSAQLAMWTAAEIATTIMAASIPVLRIVVQQLLTSHGKSNPYHRSAADGTFKSGTKTHTTVVTSAARDRVRYGSRRGSHPKRGDGTQMSDIGLGPESNGKIVRVATVTVDFASRTAADSMLEDTRDDVGIELSQVPPARTYVGREKWEHA